MTLKFLESKKAILDFKYAKDELKIKKEMVSIIESLFEDAVNNYLDKEPEIKKVWDNPVEVDYTRNVVITESVNFKSDADIKYLYREIVKKTHPDKISHLSLEEISFRSDIYIDAVESYNNNDIYDLIYYAYCLKIEIDPNIIDIKSINEQTKKFISESNFLENSFAWKWYNSLDIEKELIVEKFLNKKLYNL